MKSPLHRSQQGEGLTFNGKTKISTPPLDRNASFALDCALRDAAWAGNLVDLRGCLADGADALTSNHHGDTALMNAVCRGNIDCAHALLAFSNPCATDVVGATPLMLAALQGSAECVSLLLASSNPLAASGDGITALMLAAEEGSISCIHLLLPVSIATAINTYGETAADMARTAGILDASLLIDAWILAQDELSELVSISPPAPSSRPGHLGASKAL